DGQRAVAHATRACELTGWKAPGRINTLAAACAEAGDFDKAVEYQKRALSFPAFAKAHGATARQVLQRYARPEADPRPAPAPGQSPRRRGGRPGSQPVVEHAGRP